MTPSHPIRDAFSRIPEHHPLRRRNFWIVVTVAALGALIMGGLYGVVAIAALVGCFAVVSWPVTRKAEPQRPMTEFEREYWGGYPYEATPPPVQPVPRARAWVDWPEVTGDVIEPPDEPVLLERPRRQIGGGS